MTVLCLDWQTAHLHGDAWIDHHRLRYRIFVERNGWDIPTHDALEYDQFDTPAAKYLLWLDPDERVRGVTRLVPTTVPYMVQALWADKVETPLPADPCVWEATRFGCDRDLDSRARTRCVAELIAACLEFALQNGIESYLGVMPIAIFKRCLARAGCDVQMLGSAFRVEGIPTGIASIAATPQSLWRVRDRAGLHRPVLAGNGREPDDPARSELKLAV